MTSIWYRSIVLGGILAIAACASYDEDAWRHPTPSAARGGVFPSAVAATSAPVDAPETTAAIVEPYAPSPAAVAAAAHQAALSAPAPVPVKPPVQVAAAPPLPASRAADVDMPTPPPSPPAIVAAADVPAAAVVPPTPVVPPVAPRAETPAAPAPLPAQPAIAATAPVAAPVVAAAAPVAAAPPPVAAPVATVTRASSSSDDAHEYILGTGDEIRLTVYGEDDLSGQYQIGSTGIVALPLVGSVEAAGRTIGQFETAVRDRLIQGYLKDPRVSVQVTNYRPFFILGEVAKPGSYPYVNGMTVLSAVASAGGYTYRADTGDIRVRHPNAAGRKEQDIDESDPVMPGDIIRVTERFF